MKAEHEAIIIDLQRKIAKQWSDSEKDAFFLTGIADDNTMTYLHHLYGRWIRNNYNLWEISWEPEIIDGVDHSPFHPDAVSSIILKELYCRGLQLEETK
jgi:hypothetical protein